MGDFTCSESRPKYPPDRRRKPTLIKLATHLCCSCLVHWEHESKDKRAKIEENIQQHGTPAESVQHLGRPGLSGGNPDSFHILITDHQMLRLTGIELVKELRTNNVYCTVALPRPIEGGPVPLMT